MRLKNFLVPAFVSCAAVVFSGCSTDEGTSEKKPAAKTPNEEGNKKGSGDANPSGPGTGNSGGNGAGTGTGVGTDNGSRSGSDANPGTGATTVSCEAQWADYVRHNAAGSFAMYRMTTTFDVDGQAGSMVMTNTQRVVQSTSDSVTIENTLTSDFQNSVTTETTTKQEFLESCGNADEVPPLQKGTERVTVPAGTFNTEWVLTRATDEGIQGTSKVWFATLASGESLMVKMLVTADEGTSNGIGTMLSELVETNKR